MKCILLSSHNYNNELAFNHAANYIKPDMKVVCIPFASDIHWQINGDFTEYKEKHFGVFSKFGIPEENIKVVRISESRSKIISMIDEADIVFFSGGYMENAMFVIKSLRLKSYFNKIKEDKLFIGESAGTLILQDKYTEIPYIEDAYKRYKVRSGLGFITGLNIIVHYDPDNINHRKNKYVVKLMDKSRKVLALKEESMIIIDGNNSEYFWLG